MKDSRASLLPCSIKLFFYLTDLPSGFCSTTLLISWNPLLKIVHRSKLWGYDRLWHLDLLQQESLFSRAFEPWRLLFNLRTFRWYSEDPIQQPNLPSQLQRDMTWHWYFCHYWDVVEGRWSIIKSSLVSAPLLGTHFFVHIERPEAEGL